LPERIFFNPISNRYEFTSIKVEAF
jgi:hypothetical protein